ncbi:hypothetical protein [Pseudoalteromonas luteoviolacea]|uniref:Uncharacterized protein n=1 Tax=Pseudoalteromonas luteoviolacea S4054 TaxID=1129367 RepID=A0A0F6A9J4_9GAMM|nr:hypothetical protein [Pseudoalteromonas luteoviolacea]AOT09346.1 hypothetical protein S4054249_16485 [Pseudoalteromonas luteoviolacea]AOT14258.1 hypothetical protein S40542_16455 [Pseudoalteromonas luteoviolacea]AOT19174.1 hypothetical protein S4054_16460 [Pseudoalteromonas luteoviolacea]KKE82084.1 hypothetical protein N479_19790 [Pseudoalteromonas luteoviolacea S4054]KZN73448.1 hypothetical protein N481_12055 [Pseudoalteromonas luteoviolacea S4047-1]
MSNEHTTITEQLAAVVTRSNALCNTVQDQINNINSTLNTKTTEVDNFVTQSKNELETKFTHLKNGFVETINGLDVFQEGLIKRFAFKSTLNAGGYTGASDGPDSSYPTCFNPQPPYYINLIEFDAQNVGSGFGYDGDTFNCDFVMAHRGMASYVDHIVISGTSQQDCVSAHVEVKKVMNSGAISLYISEPGEEPREIPITAADVGKTLTVFFRQINKGYSNGRARVTLKVDTRPHCGSTRAFLAKCEYSSVNGRPCADRISQTAPTWEQ